MSYPWGQREKITICWEDAKKTTKMRVVKGKFEAKGSRKHCAEQLVRWLVQKELISVFDLAQFVLFKLDAYKAPEYRLFGHFLRWLDKGDNNTKPEEETTSVIGSH